MLRSSSFSMRELYRALAIELTRANADFALSQVAAAEDCNVDFANNKIQLDNLPLEITRVELELSLVAIKQTWLQSLQCKIRSWFSKSATILVSSTELRFQFAALGAKDVQVIKCILERDARGHFRAHVDEVADA